MFAVSKNAPPLSVWRIVPFLPHIQPLSGDVNERLLRSFVVLLVCAIQLILNWKFSKLFQNRRLTRRWWNQSLNRSKCICCAAYISKPGPSLVGGLNNNSVITYSPSVVTVIKPYAIVVLGKGWLMRVPPKSSGIRIPQSGKMNQRHAQNLRSWNKHRNYQRYCWCC